LGGGGGDAYLHMSVRAVAGALAHIHAGVYAKFKQQNEILSNNVYIFISK
jgi:hypothetical protein